MKEVQWLFFDAGDTLVDETVAIRKRIEDIIAYEKERGRVFTYDDIYNAIATAAKEYKRYLFSGGVAMLGIQWEPPHDKNLEVPFPGTAEVLKKLKEKYNIAILANQSLGTEARMARVGLLPYIDRVFTSAEVGLEKPDPRFFQHAFDETGATPATSVMIGDRLDNDVLPAKQMGMKTIWVRQGFGKYQTARSAEYEPDFAVDNLEGLLAVLL